MINEFIKQNEVERRFVETGEYDKNDKQLDFLVRLHKKNGTYRQLIEGLAVEVAKNYQSINSYKESAAQVHYNAKMNITLRNNNLIDLHGKFKAKTAICVAFGPSLEKNIDHLFKIKDKYKIIAVDRAIDYLSKRGIKPDYYVTLDAFADSAWIPETDLCGVKLLAIAGSNYGFNKKFTEQGGDLYLFVSIDRMDAYKEILEITGDLPYMSCSGNVGHGALSASIYLFQSKKTILVGFDNAFNDKYYPDMETPDFGDKLRETIDIYGNKTNTLDEFVSYNYYMQETILTAENCDKVVNCTEGGILAIKNIDKLINY